MELPSVDVFQDLIIFLVKAPLKAVQLEEQINRQHLTVLKDPLEDHHSVCQIEFNHKSSVLEILVNPVLVEPMLNAVLLETEQFVLVEQTLLETLTVTARWILANKIHVVSMLSVKIQVREIPFFLFLSH